RGDPRRPGARAAAAQRLLPVRQRPLGRLQRRPARPADGGGDAGGGWAAVWRRGPPRGGPPGSGSRRGPSRWSRCGRPWPGRPTWRCSGAACRRATSRAPALAVAALALVWGVSFGLTVTERAPYLDVLFETFSAFGTVGLSTGLTP